MVSVEVIVSLRKITVSKPDGPVQHFTGARSVALNNLPLLSNYTKLVVAHALPPATTNHAKCHIAIETLTEHVVLTATIHSKTRSPTWTPPTRCH